jgi:hypothetical protein
MPRIFGYQITTADTLYGPIVLADNQVVPAPFTSLPASTTKYVQLQYGMIRNGQTKTGHLTIATDGTSITSITDEDTELSDLGVSFTANIVGPNLNIDYSTTSTGFTTSISYYQKAWNS